MIKFFRHIRQSLIMENKTSKYFKYAIGEIILVVIGILIALQINTWNEQRKEQQQLKIALTSIYQDLVGDSTLIFNRIPLAKLRYNAIEALIKRSYATETNLDTLIKIMQNEFPVRWYSSPPYNTNTFSNLKSTGTFEVLPLSIKEALSDYYTWIEFSRDNNKQTLDQYRNQLDEFVRQYNIIGRLYDENYKNSYIYNSTWENVDGRDFAPRTAVLMAAYKVLYQNAVYELESTLDKVRGLLPKLQPYLKDN